ncbi:MAG: hypothetical protein C0601_13390 [Candidatus Muiribacterium halophilum]|uniref:HAMP domain-containing protein n=1 Tax=Muiribacterium halophilum TaxID=2053465 RepID=A0A2N5Z9G5_MUIH1|nr:MAG: hypothetical protein C0601_13390 [Candidatus Muirbacterium halophilum]
MAEKNFRRKIFLIKRGLQFRYMFSVVMIMLISALIVGWSIYYSIWSKIADPASFQYAELDTIWTNVNMLLFIRVPILVVFVSLFSLILSHKIAGPVYRFEQSSKKIANGDLSLRIKLRQGDELTELADIFNKMTENLETFVVKDREVIEKVIGIINQVPMTLKQDEIDEEEKERIILELTEVVTELKELTYAFKVSQDKIQ